MASMAVALSFPLIKMAVIAVAIIQRRISNLVLTFTFMAVL